MKTDYPANLSDIYIMLPCHFPDQEDSNRIAGETPTEEASLFLKTLSETSEYECISDIPRQLERCYLGDFYFACCDDDYEYAPSEFLPQARIFQTLRSALYLTRHPATGLAVLFLAIPGSDYDYTFIADQISTEYLYISRTADGPFRLLSAFLKQEFALHQLDVPRAVFTLPDKPKPLNKLENLLAGDAYNSQHVSYNVSSEVLKKAAAENIAVFDFYEAYVSSRFLVYILNDFSLVYKENLENEIAMLFICELILFQNAAIARTNEKITKELTSPRKISLKTIEEMNTEYGKTILFWNKGNFQYFLVQELSDRIRQAFGTMQLQEDYHKNQAHLEHIVDINGSISSEKEGKIINFLAIFLAVIQIIPLVSEWIRYLSDSTHAISPVHTLGGLAAVLFFFVLAAVHRRRTAKYKKNKKRS